MRKWPKNLDTPETRQLVSTLAENPKILRRMRVAPPRQVRRLACRVSDFAWPEFKVRGNRHPGWGLKRRRAERARRAQRAEQAQQTQTAQQAAW